MTFNWSCERLGTKSVSYPCTPERVKQTHKCKGCTGAIQIPQEEVSNVSSPCNYKGCKKNQAFRGFCIEHVKEEGLYKQYQDHNELKKANKQLIEKIKDEVEVVNKNTSPVVSIDPLPEITQAEIRHCDEIFYLRKLMDDKLELWTTELSSARNIKQRAEFFISMCNAAENLGY